MARGFVPNKAKLKPVGQNGLELDLSVPDISRMSGPSSERPSSKDLERCLRDSRMLYYEEVYPYGFSLNIDFVLEQLRKTEEKWVQGQETHPLATAFWSACYERHHDPGSFAAREEYLRGYAEFLSEHDRPYYTFDDSEVLQSYKTVAPEPDAKNRASPPQAPKTSIWEALDPSGFVVYDEEAAKQRPAFFRSGSTSVAAQTETTAGSDAPTAEENTDLHEVDKENDAGSAPAASAASTSPRNPIDLLNPVRMVTPIRLRRREYLGNLDLPEPPPLAIGNVPAVNRNIPSEASGTSPSPQGANVQSRTSSLLALPPSNVSADENSSPSQTSPLAPPTEHPSPTASRRSGGRSPRYNPYPSPHSHALHAAMSTTRTPSERARKFPTPRGAKSASVALQRRSRARARQTKAVSTTVTEAELEGVEKEYEPESDHAEAEE
ncbi:MAG: hypothetical protein M4579_007065, partial [Chaenotheca gracillima]